MRALAFEGRESVRALALEHSSESVFLGVYSLQVAFGTVRQKEKSLSFMSVNKNSLKAVCQKALDELQRVRREVNYHVH